MPAYFGLAISDSMFDGEALIHRRPITPEEAAEYVDGGVVSCINPAHTPTIDAMRRRFSLNVPAPDHPPVIKLQTGDTLVVAGVRGLPRLEGRHEYSREEIESAEFSFALWEVQ